jgi:hypothetical protein
MHTYALRTIDPNLLPRQVPLAGSPVAEAQGIECLYRDVDLLAVRQILRL